MPVIQALQSELRSAALSLVVWCYSYSIYFCFATLFYEVLRSLLTTQTAKSLMSGGGALISYFFMEKRTSRLQFNAALKQRGNAGNTEEEIYMYREQHVSMCAGGGKHFCRKETTVKSSGRATTFQCLTYMWATSSFLLGECTCLKVTSNGHLLMS